MSLLWENTTPTDILYQELCTELVSKSKYLLQIILSQSRDKQELKYIHTKINYVITINRS